MKEERAFKFGFLIVSILTTLVVVLRCIKVPFSHDEVATFFFYIQPGDFIPFYAHPDANGHFLTSLTSWICFRLFGSEVWSLRIPCILAYIVLCFAVYKNSTLFNSIFTRSIFAGSFLLCFNFVAFYALCRGYGLSMAFLLLALYHWFQFMQAAGWGHLFKFVVFSQLALSANLTLVVVLLVLSAFVVFQLMRRKQFLVGTHLLALALQGGLIYFWLRYAFYLKESGALYYGAGESYWQVTFKSLIETLFVENKLLNIFIVGVCGGLFLLWCWRIIKSGIWYIIDNLFGLSFILFAILVVAFFLMKALLGVNYPEDRTGLFFYLFFVFAFCFCIDEAKRLVQAGFLIVPLLLGFHFVLNVNFNNHPWRVYETMPLSFFNILQKEQQKETKRITIAGHRVREFFYGFINYNQAEKLNHITSPEALQMNCDYALAYRQDSVYYDPYYTELAREDKWHFRLLKRRLPLERKLLYETNQAKVLDGNHEYFNAYERLDTTFNSGNPLQAEFTLNVESASVPLNAWLVLQVDGADESENQFVRVPLNLVHYDWNGKRMKLDIVTGNIPLKIKRIVAYIWNIDKQPLKLSIENFSLMQLNGEGVTLQSQAKI